MAAGGKHGPRPAPETTFDRPLEKVCVYTGDRDVVRGWEGSPCATNGEVGERMRRPKLGHPPVLDPEFHEERKRSYLSYGWYLRAAEAHVCVDGFRDDEEEFREMMYAIGSRRARVDPVPDLPEDQPCEICRGTDFDDTPQECALCDRRACGDCVSVGITREHSPGITSIVVCRSCTVTLAAHGMNHRLGVIMPLRATPLDFPIDTRRHANTCASCRASLKCETCEGAGMCPETDPKTGLLNINSLCGACIDVARIDTVFPPEETECGCSTCFYLLREGHLEFAEGIRPRCTSCAGLDVYLVRNLAAREGGATEEARLLAALPVNVIRLVSELSAAAPEKASAPPS